jgi:fibronectin type 3 domain-containing protein
MYNIYRRENGKSEAQLVAITEENVFPLRSWIRGLGLVNNTNKVR